MPKEYLRRRAQEMIADEARYRLPIQLRYLLVGLATGLVLGGAVASLS